MAIYKAINSKGSKTHGAMMNTLKYVLNPDKTGSDLCYVTSEYNYSEITAKNVYLSFLDTKREWGKDEGRQYLHSVISWHKDEKITPETALQFGIRFAEHTYPGHQTAVIVHTDKDHIHCHLVANTVNSLDGSKINKTKYDLKRDKDFCDQLCRSYGLTITEKGKHFDGTEMQKGEIVSWIQPAYRLLTNIKKPSFIADCGLAVIRSIEHAQSKEQFIAKMQSLGWFTRWEEKRKNITFQNNEGKKVRDTTLKKTFGIDATKEGLSIEFTRTRSRAEAASGSYTTGSQQPERSGREDKLSAEQDPEAKGLQPTAGNTYSRSEGSDRKAKRTHRSI